MSYSMLLELDMMLTKKGMKRGDQDADRQEEDMSAMNGVDGKG